MLAEDPELTRDVDEILNTSPPCDVLLDFAGVAFVNSANLSLFVRLRQHLGDRDRSLQLRNIQPTVLKAFSVTGLDRLFEIG